MKYGIIVDSGCDLRSLDGAEESGILFRRVPLKLRVGEKEFVDSIDLDVEQYRREVKSYSGKTGSAAPSPEEWAASFRGAEEMVAVTITGSLSGSYNSALAGKKLVQEQFPGKKIHVIDSKSAGPEISLIARRLRELMADGLPFEQIVEKITEYQRHTHLLFVLESLENFVKNGRVSRLAGSLATVLGIKVLGRASAEGTLEILKKCRGQSAAYEKMLEEVFSSGCQGGRFILSHCGNPERAAALTGTLREHYPDCSVSVMPTSALCSYYAQENGILLAFEA